MPTFLSERYVRLQDLVWIALFAILIFHSQTHSAPEITFLVALAIAQVIESRVPFLNSMRGSIFWVVIKTALGYGLIGYTGGVTSSYWVVLMLPVVSSAVSLGVTGTLIVSIFVAGSYLSFLLFIDWSQKMLDAEAVNQLVLRGVSLAMVGTLASSLAEDLRIQTQNSRRSADQLSAANYQLEKAEDAVRRSDRLAALGQLSAGLAHELRNPLGTIRASSEMLTTAVSKENEVAREVAGFISSEVDRCNSLITRFLHFARPLELQADKADLAQTIDQAITNVEREAPEISIYKNYAPEIPPFRFDAELMERVVYNLISNAAQASPKGGTVTVKTRAADGTAEISVIDRGAGIEPANLNTIFNPFFTTKPAGVGLGLAIVAKIVDEHHGKISVESEPGRGSVFRVQIPMA
ncbi:MAG TPA: ATP-binding protein [Bryobacteraceae bacterium]|nr:ATP-binding protein [Bryobacteraceae bacterium]